MPDKKKAKYWHERAQQKYFPKGKKRKKSTMTDKEKAARRQAISSELLGR